MSTRTSTFEFFQLVTLIVALLVFLFLKPALAEDPYAPCQYYQNKAKELGCDDSNYLISFGFKFCKGYIDKEPQFSSEGQGVLDQIRSCLIQTLEDRQDLTCANVQAIAEKSHFTCYVKERFCSMDLRDKLLTLEVAKPELLNPQFLEQAEKIGFSCLKPSDKAPDRNDDFILKME